MKMPQRRRTRMTVPRCPILRLRPRRNPPSQRRRRRRPSRLAMTGGCTTRRCGRCAQALPPRSRCTCERAVLPGRVPVLPAPSTQTATAASVAALPPHTTARVSRQALEIGKKAGSARASVGWADRERTLLVRCGRPSPCTARPVVRLALEGHAGDVAPFATNPRSSVVVCCCACGRRSPDNNMLPDGGSAAALGRGPPSQAATNGCMDSLRG